MADEKEFFIASCSITFHTCKSSTVKNILTAEYSRVTVVRRSRCVVHNLGDLEQKQNVPAFQLLSNFERVVGKQTKHKDKISVASIFGTLTQLCAATNTALKGERQSVRPLSHKKRYTRDATRHPIMTEHVASLRRIVYALTPLISSFGKIGVGKEQKKAFASSGRPKRRLYGDFRLDKSKISLPEMAPARSTPSFGSLIADHFSEGKRLCRLLILFATSYGWLNLLPFSCSLISLSAHSILLFVAALLRFMRMHPLHRQSVRFSDADACGCTPCERNGSLTVIREA